MLMNKAKNLDLIKSVTVGRGENSLEISHLFFADSTLMF